MDYGFDLGCDAPCYNHPYGSRIPSFEQLIHCLHTFLCYNCCRNPLVIGWLIVLSRVDSTRGALLRIDTMMNLLSFLSSSVVVAGKSRLDSINPWPSGEIQYSIVDRMSAITRAAYFQGRSRSCDSSWISCLMMNLKRWRLSQKVNHKVRIPSTNPMQPNSTVPTSPGLHPRWLSDFETEFGDDEFVA